MVISLYFHLPFCTKKCPYCHFYVVPNRNQAPFINALLQEWELRSSSIQGKEILSLYFGGGTPSLCLEGIQKILDRVSAHEITVEANPEDVTPILMAQLKKMGVNRISLGVQSFDNILLKHLGRTHTAQKAQEAVYLTREAGIENITIDLMYELPYQTLSQWKETVDAAIALPITHLSLYNLTIEPHTPFKKREKELLPHLPTEEEGAAMLEYACQRFEEGGLKRYEISAFARDDKRSIHNTGYWTGREFIGYGPSAFSYQEGKRFQNVCHLGRYIRACEGGKLPTDFEEKLSPKQRLHEQIAIGLRLFEGIALESLPQETHTRLKELENEGWLTLSKTHAKLTEKGALFYDTVAESLIEIDSI